MTSYVQSFDQTLSERTGVPRLHRRMKGPAETDYALNLFVERTADRRRLIYGVMNDGFHLLVGEAAAGKTTLVRDTGRHLRDHANQDVWVLDAEVIDHADIADCITDLNNVFGDNPRRGNQTLIFENIHRSFEPANEVIGYIFDQGIRTLFTTRPQTLRDYVDVKYDNHLRKIAIGKQSRHVTYITGESIAEKIIEDVSDYSGITLNEKQKSELISICDGDLFKLGFLLESYRAYDEIGLNAIDRHIQEEFKELISGPKDSEKTVAIARLAALGIYEIGLPPLAAEKIVEKNTIDSLRELNLLRDSGSSIVFFHSSIASLYFSILRKSLDDPLSDQGHLLADTIARALDLVGPDYLPVVIKRLCLYPSIIELLLRRDEIRHRLIDYVKNSSVDLSAIADFITDCCRKGNRNIADLVTEILEEAFYSVVDKLNDDDDIEELAFFLGSVPWRVLDEFVEPAFELGNLLGGKTRIDHPCQYAIGDQGDEPRLKDYARLVDLTPSILQIYDHVQPCTRIRGHDRPYMCGKSLLCEASVLNTRLIEAIDRTRLLARMREWDDPYDIVALLHTINWADERKGSAIAAAIARSMPELPNRIAIMPNLERREYATNVLKRIEGEVSS